MKKWLRLFVLLSVSIFFTSLMPVFTQSAESAKRVNDHFVLVHGGWHGAWSWYKVAPMLRTWGYDVTVVDLPGHGSDATPPGEVTFYDYQSVLVKTLDAIKGKVILVGHGTSGGFINAAAEARPEKIKKLVYIAGVLTPDGASVADILLGDEESLGVQHAIIDPEAGTVIIDPEAIDKAVYNMTSPADIKFAKKNMRPEPLNPLFVPLSLTDERFGSIERYYIKTLQDHSLTTSYQETLLQIMPCKAVYSINSDHAPFFSKPRELVQILSTIAETGYRQYEAAAFAEEYLLNW